MSARQGSLHNGCMLDVHAIKAQDLSVLSAAELAPLAAQMLAHISEQSKQISEQSKHIGEQDKRIDSQAQAIKWRDAKIESITFQLARLKAWKFGAKTERMNAEQREIFEETLAADQASLEAQLAALQGTAKGDTPGAGAPDKQPRRQPKREPLSPHLPRVDQRIEPEDTHCPAPECGQAMVRVGEDISERLDIIPAKFFVQRQIRGKWACKCCHLLLQEPAAPQVFDNALPTPGLQAHTAISRFVDHIPYYRQEQINARSGVRTPRSTLAAWGGQTGAQLMPLYDAHRVFVLGSRVVHADETPIALLDPGGGKTKKAYMWAYARGAFEAEPGVVFDFCAGRGGQYPCEFLKGWAGTLVVDAYSGYDAALSLDGRSTAYCLAHYPERCFILSTRPAVAAHETQNTGVALGIIPTRATGRDIRTHVVDVYRPHGHSLRQLAAHRTSADGSGHVAGVARRSQHQRHRCAALSAMDRALPRLLWGAWSR